MPNYWPSHTVRSGPSVIHVDGKQMAERISEQEQLWDRQELMGLLSVSGTLAGLCITIVALFHADSQGSGTIVDDVLAVCSAAFLGCIYLIVWALRTRAANRADLLVKCVDALFLTALSAMTLSAFIMVYSIW